MDGISIIIGLIVVIVVLITIILDEHKKTERYRKDWEYCNDLLMQERENKNMDKDEQLQKEKEDKEIEKLRNAKTGVPITIGTSYGIPGPNGEDDGRRWIRKKDAEAELERRKKLTEK